MSSACLSRSYNTFSDDILVQRYQEGDSVAFDHLLARYESTIKNYVYYFVQDEDLTKDIFQEVCIRLFISIKDGEKYKNQGKFKSWLMWVTHNAIIKEFRRMDTSKLTYIENYNMYSEVEDEIDESYSIIAHLPQMIKALPENMQEILNLHYFQNLKFKEIADQKGISINTALGRMRYAINRLRKMSNY